MSQNHIHNLRKSKGLTQSQLAAQVGTSQQQIQRIEAGVQAARLDLAVKIAEVLGAKLGDVFPKLKKGRTGSHSKRDEESQLADAGIDSDPAQWTVKFFINDGRVLLFGVTSREKKRIEQIVGSSAGEKSFVVFDAESRRVAVNLS